MSYLVHQSGFLVELSSTSIFYLRVQYLNSCQSYSLKLCDDYNSFGFIHNGQVGETLLRMFVEETPISAQTADTCKSMEALDFSKGESDGQSPVPKETKFGGVLSTPAVRILAKQFGIDVNSVCGTGKDGRVLKEDVYNYAANKGIKVNLGSLSASQEQSHGEMYREVSAANAREYEDKTIQLRYVSNTNIIPNRFYSATCAPQVPKNNPYLLCPAR